MIIGNDRAQEILNQFFSLITQKKKIDFPFLLLNGPQHLGKTSILETHIAQLMGFFSHQDYRALYDLSEYLGKKHTLRIEVPTKDQIKEIDGKVYIDRGVRETISWLSLAPAGDYKVVYLENIERMNNSSSNALLKTLEEPLQNRLIVATTTNKASLLDTIISRAFVVDFVPVSDQQITEYIHSYHAEVDPSIATFLSGFSLGKVGMIEKFLSGDIEQLKDMAKHFTGLTGYLHGTSRLVDTYEHMLYFQEQHMWKQLCEALAFIGSAKQVFPKVRELISAYDLARTSVNPAHVAFSLSLS